MYLDFDDSTNLKHQIKGLQPTNGVCIFIDICGSTAVKRKDLKEWILLIGNTIRLCSGSSNLFKDNVLKLIGDEIMIFISDDKIKTANENHATVLDFLKICISSNGPTINNLTLRTKASIHYCSDTYNISFSKNADDYYGNDIDLTARLMKLSKKNKIVISETYYQKVNSIDPSFLTNTTKKPPVKLKGITGKTGYRIMKIK